MRTALSRLLLMLLALTLVATTAEAQRKRGDRNKLTRTELDEAGSAIVTARDAIRVLRPQWLQPPIGRMASADVGGRNAGGGGETAIVVYLDDIRQSDIDALTTIQASQVVEMRYLDQNRAVQLHGPGHESGVIEVTTVNKKK